MLEEGRGEIHTQHAIDLSSAVSDSQQQQTNSCFNHPKHFINYLVLPTKLCSLNASRNVDHLNINYFIKLR